MRLRKVTHTLKGVRATDGAGVSLMRVLGANTTDTYDPFLMLDSFDSTDPDDYRAGFPMHPHRGIETVTFAARGTMVHEDHLGTKATVTDGEAQWLTAGSGAFHSEMPQATERLLGVQLWLNLPAKDKLTAPPSYHGITREEIREFPFEGGTLRLVAGTYGDAHGYQGKYLPLDYYDIHLDPHAAITLDVPGARSVMAFTLLGGAAISGHKVAEKNAVKLGDGDTVTIGALDEPAEVLFMPSVRLDEPVAWYGPIVMNTKEELLDAFGELEDGTFVKQAVSYAGK